MSIFTRLNKINWISDIFPPLCIILMEVSIVYPWLVFIGKIPRLAVQQTPLSLLSLVFLLGGSFIATKFFLSRKWSLLWVQTSIMACGLAAILLVLLIEYGIGSSLSGSQWSAYYGQALLDSFSRPHPLVFAILAGFYLWWRGISLNRSTLYFDRIYTSFLIGLGAFVPLIIIWGVIFRNGSFQDLVSEIGIYIAAFFFFGLVSLALSNLRIIQERLKARGETSKTFGRRWLTIITGIIGGIILLGISLASIFSTQFFSALGRVLSSTSDVLYKIVYYLLLPIGYLVQFLYYIWKFLINLLRTGQPPEAFEPFDLTDPEKLPEVTEGVISPEIIQALKWTVLALVLIVVVFFITRTIMRSRARAREEIEEEQESLFSWGEFKSDLKTFLKMLFQRFRRKPKPVPLSTLPKWQPDEDLNQRLSIREIYQHLLWQAARLRIPRETYETPYEYARRLERVVPDGKEPLNEITGLYVGARYGEHKVEERKIDNANNVWQRLRELLKRFDGN